MAILLTLISCQAQEVKKEPEKSKMDMLISKTGSITTFVDVKLPALKTQYESAQTRIRKVTNGTATALFYQIVKEGKYGNTTASIEASDLIEIIKALDILIDQVDGHILANPDYMENKFVTVDGFQVGYFIANKKATWYINLEKIGNDSTLFIGDPNVISGAFLEAKSEMDQLKKKM